MQRLLIGLMILLSFSAQGQSYGNEWIDYSQQYLKIKVTNDQIYRIDSAALADAFAGIGVNLATVDPRELQMFGREQELYIHVQGEGDGSFDGGDFVEFYGQRNDAWLDTTVWEDNADQNNPYYSLYNDTATYYLTWNPGSGGSNRRMQLETASDFANYTAISWIWKTSYYMTTGGFFQGQKSGDVALPLFTRGEGWFGWPSLASTNGTNINAPVITTNPYSGPGAPNARVRSLAASISNPSPLPNTNFNHHWRIGYAGTVYYDTVYFGYDLLDLSFEVPASDLSNSSSNFIHTGFNDYTSGTSYHALSNVTVTYAHTLNMGGVGSMAFTVPENQLENKSYLNISNFGNGAALLYDITDQYKRITVVSNAGAHEALVPNHGGVDASCFLTQESSVVQLTASDLQPATSNSGYFTDYLAGNIEDVYIIVSQEQLWSAAQGYATYRSNTGYNVLLVDVDELYDQYSAGIVKHPVAIRRFCAELYNTSVVKPNHLFLIGKSIRPHGEWQDNGSRNNATLYQQNMVPAYGNPLSDIMITAGLQGDGRVPAIPVGRIAALTEQEVNDYLAKVMDYESQPYQEWMKNVLHFGGGATPGEQSSFANFLLQYENIVEDTSFGGEVHTFLKNSSAPIQINLSDSVRNLIDGGVSIMTFFGHAGGTGFDQSIDLPENYNNQGKYPVLIGNSCFTGDIHQPQQLSTSEDWVLIPDKGVIGFIASTKLGIPGDLHQYSRNLYQQFSAINYGGTIGQCMAATIDSIDAPGDFNRDNVVLSMNLHGDPAIRINHDTLPDFRVDVQSVFFDPPEITAAVDSFRINIELKNIGKGINDSILVYVTREYPDGSDTTYTLSQPGLLYIDTLAFWMPTDELNGAGLNRFYVEVDIPSFITEREDLANNTTEADLLIVTGGILPIWPYEYAVYPRNTVTLKASTGDPFAAPQDYTFEIDVTDEFNTSFKITEVVNAPGGVVEWQPMSGGSPLQLTDSTVYFWRVTGDSIWQESSFQYIVDREGWGQAHHHQFKNDQYSLVEYQRDPDEFNFVPISKNVYCQTIGNANSQLEWAGTTWRLDLDWDDNGCLVIPALHVGIIDPVSLEAWGTHGYQGQNGPVINQQHQYGNYNNLGDYQAANCRDRSQLFFGFWQPTQYGMMDTLDYMLNYAVPDSHYILIYTFLYATTDTWGSNLTNTLQSLGATNINQVDSVPFIFFCQKGNPSSAIEIYGATIDDVIEMSTAVNAEFNFGTITSEIAGPAAAWEALYWEQHPKNGEPATHDSTSIEVIGIKLDGSEQLLATFDESVDSVIDLYNYVDATEFPYVKLRAFLQDDSTVTPAQLDRWQLLYQPVPEAAVNPPLGHYLSVDTAQEGQEIQLAVAIENISDYHMDSLLVSYYVEDANRILHHIPYQRQDSLRSGDVLLDTVSFSTENLPGWNYLWVEVNPTDTATGQYDQLEQYHFNNLLYQRFYVTTDQINPILDVTFDGIHIMDGEIVSSKPQILITLDDENPYLVMDQPEDTVNFKVYLYDPNGVEQRIYFQDANGNAILDFIPASLPENKFAIHYNPTLTEDGVYRLLVQATDKSDNVSGSHDFQINFEVINRQTVTEVMNYPNPFSTSTRFVFTLTGDAPPEHFTIQIMTITGRVVREIHEDELGQLRIGRNITEYAWDGRDEFGDPLANGVYLYRVIVKDDLLQDVELRETDASQWFKQGYGKMYLMR